MLAYFGSGSEGYVKNDKKYSIVDNLPLPPETMVNYKKATQPKYKEF